MYNPITLVLYFFYYLFILTEALPRILNT